MARKASSKIRLPRNTAKHPFLVALDRWGSEGRTKTELAKELGVTPQSLNSWRVACLEDRDFLLPASLAAMVANKVGMSPRLFRPDIWSLYGTRQGDEAGE